MGRRGEITVFLALILVSVWALLCGLVESARTAGARCYLRQALNSSMDSLLSQYHRQLWEKYRLLGLEYADGEGLGRELSGFLEPYLAAENWYPMEDEGMEQVEVVSLTDGNGRYFEEQVLDYMKYGLLQADWDGMDEGEALELFHMVKEAGTVKEVASLYEGHTREAVRLEKALEALDSRLKKQKECWQEALEELEDLDGGGFEGKAEDMIKELKKVPGLVEDYEKKADALDSRLKESRRQYEEKSGDLSGEVKAGLEAEIEKYETYVSKDGERRKQIEGLSGESGAACSYIEGVIEEAREVQEYIDNWEPDEDGEDDLDEEALWRPVRNRWEGCPVLSLDVEFGVADPEKEGFLENVGDLISGGLLELVLPEGAQVSERKPDLTAAPSVVHGGAEGGNGAGLVDRLMLGEYGLRFFGRYGDGNEEDGCCAYETEYILFGKTQDRENLKSAVSTLVAVREGMNLIHILSDPQKRQEAQNLALAIVGGTGLVPLTGVVAFFIMGIWALGEALMDVRALLDGGKAPLIKTRENWRLDLAGLLKMGQERSVKAAGGGEGQDEGLDYGGYLRLFLFFTHSAGTDYRMMDMIQANIQLSQEEFQVGRCAHQVDMRASVCGKHVFFSLGLWKSVMGGGDGLYRMKMAVSGSY